MFGLVFLTSFCDMTDWDVILKRVILNVRIVNVILGLFVAWTVAHLEVDSNVRDVLSLLTIPPLYIASK